VSKASTSMQSSFARRHRRLSAAIEGLESRAYLNGVVFGPPHNTDAAGAGVAPVYTDLVDLNGDFKADLVTANVATGSDSISILLGNGDGTFGTAQTFPVSFSPLTIVDGPLSGNSGKLIAVGSTTDNAPSVEVITEASVSNPSTFTSQTLTASGLTNTQSVTLGDFFGDGRQDIAVASFDGGTSNNVAIFRNLGGGAFSLAQVVSVPHAHLASITSFAQSNGTVDLAVADANENAVTVLTNDGSGAFSVGANADYGVGAEPVTIKSGKFNQNSDSNDDLVTANAAGGSVSVLLGNGDGTFNSTRVDSAVSGVPAGGGPLKVRVSNLNADNNPDLLGLLSSNVSGDAEVLLGNGNGTFHVGSIIPPSGNAKTSIAAGDLAGNGLTGLVLANTGTITALVNITNQDHTPPTATVSGASSSGLNSTDIQFVVNYSDDNQVDSSTLGNGNITVTDPSGAARPVTLVSTNLANGATVSATYSIPATGGALGVGDNGSYTVTATSDTAAAVKDANGNPLAGGMVGTFTVAVSTNGPNLVAGAVRVRFPASVVSGVTRTAGATVPVLNTGTAIASGRMVLNLYASTDATTVNGATLLGTINRAVRLRPGARTAYAFPGFKWPAGLGGSYFLVAQVNATNTVQETTPADNLGASATAASVAAPFVDLQNLWNQRTPATLKANRRAALSVLIQNHGNVTAKGTGTATIMASPSGSLSDATLLATVPIHIAVAAGHKQAVPAGFTVPGTLASGTYHLIVTISFSADSNAANDTVIGSGTFTI
jgi:hypothetical protein